MSLKLTFFQDIKVLFLFKNNTESLIMLNTRRKTKSRKRNLLVRNQTILRSDFIAKLLRKHVIEYNCSATELYRFCSYITEIIKPLPQQYNLLFCLALNCLIDENLRWLKFFGFNNFF